MRVAEDVEGREVSRRPAEHSQRPLAPSTVKIRQSAAKMRSAATELRARGSNLQVRKPNMDASAVAKKSGPVDSVNRESRAGTLGASSPRTQNAAKCGKCSIVPPALFAVH